MLPLDLSLYITESILDLILALADAALRFVANHFFCCCWCVSDVGVHVIAGQARDNSSWQKDHTSIQNPILSNTAAPCCSSILYNLINIFHIPTAPECYNGQASVQDSTDEHTQGVRYSSAANVEFIASDLPDVGEI